MDGVNPIYSNGFFEPVKQEDQMCSNQGQQFEQLEQQGHGCLGLQQIGEEFSYRSSFGTTLGMDEDQEKKIKSEMELNNLQTNNMALALNHKDTFKDDKLWCVRMRKIWRKFHIYFFFKITMEKGIVYIHLVKFPTFCSNKTKET